MSSRPIRMDDDTPNYGVPLRERYERFCGTFVASRNPMHAFRLAFVVDKSLTLAMLEREAKRVLADPAIAQRVQEMRDDAANQTVASIREIISDLHDIATADPNELVSHVLESCRFCHGLDHRYQWVDMGEYVKSCDNTARLTPDAPLPDMAGGFGYHPTTPPNMTCPCCFGRGQGNIIFRDTTQLSPKGAKLYAGVKKTKDGMEVLMHDQMKAREQLCRIMGAFKDGAVVPGTPAAVPDAARITPEMKEQDAGRAYLQLLQGGKAG